MVQKEKILITKVEQQSRNKNRYSIYVNGEYYTSISEDVLVKYNLLKGKLIDREILREINNEEEQNKANNYALRLLSFRSRSEQEIILKMKGKDYDEEVINNTITFLKRHNYLDDEAFASNFAKSRLNNQSFGKVRIKQELYYKGISKEIINTTLEGLSDSEEEYSRALNIAKKKLETSYKSDDKQAQYRKLGSFLQRRGFEYDVISKVLNKLL